MTVRFYSSVAAETTLTGAITNASTMATIALAVGLPSSTPFTLALDYESAGEELVEVTAIAGTNLTITRGIDGTSATSHNAGARVRHVASARDYADSRSHENADDGIHGLSPGEELVGTTKVQSLSNKTLVDATGTLKRITISNDDTGGAWTTTVFGDSGTPNQNLMEWKPTSVTNRVASVSSNGGYIQVNKSATEDASISLNAFAAFKSDATTAITRILSGGEVTTRLSAGARGFVVRPNADATSQSAYLVRNVADSTTSYVVNTNGTMTITGQEPANQITAVAAVGQAATTPVIRVRNSTPTTVASITTDGTVLCSAVNSDITSTPGQEVEDTVGASSDRYVTYKDTAGVEVASVRRGGDAYFKRIFDQDTGIQYRAVQSGTVSVSFTSQLNHTVAVAFPIAFPSVPMVSTNINSAAGETGQWYSRAFGISTTGFTLQLNRTDLDVGAQTWSSIPVQWSATEM